MLIRIIGIQNIVMKNKENWKKKILKIFFFKKYLKTIFS